MHLRVAAAAAFFSFLALPIALSASPLRAGDHVQVSVFNHPELSLSQGTVDADGKLAIPLVGNVAVAGVEPDAAAARIGDSLHAYLRRPSVTLSILQQNGSISLIGTPISTVSYVPGQTLSSIVASMQTTPGVD